MIGSGNVPREGSAPDGPSEALPVHATRSVAIAISPARRRSLILEAYARERLRGEVRYSAPGRGPRETRKHDSLCGPMPRGGPLGDSGEGRARGRMSS